MTYVVIATVLLSDDYDLIHTDKKDFGYDKRWLMMTYVVIATVFLSDDYDLYFLCRKYLLQ